MRHRLTLLSQRLRRPKTAPAGPPRHVEDGSRPWHGAATMAVLYGPIVALGLGAVWAWIELFHG